jgi:anti-sigma B factor antagonist
MATAADFQRLFELEIRPERERVVVAPLGEVDLLTAPDVTAAVADLLARDFHHVVVDLRGVTFLDSSGVRSLFLADAAARDAGARLSVIPGTPTVQRPLEIAGIAERLDVLSR